MILELSFLTFAHTLAERNNSQIENEAFAMIFAFKKFQKMLYARHFSLVTDHKALNIFGSKITSQCIFKQSEKMGNYFCEIITIL